MGYSFRKNSRYRMPTHFGPSLGPRQGPGGRLYFCADTPKQTVVHARFEAKKYQLSKLLPPGFHLREPCRIDFSFAYITEIEWLAGRGYNTFGVSIPAAYKGQVDAVVGDFLLVLWENMADPIITGREELGFSKVYCEIPPLRGAGDTVNCRASWDGCQFASLDLTGLKEVATEALPDSAPSDGLLHYKYIPETGNVDAADAQYATLSPAEDSNLQVIRGVVADHALCDFRQSTWEELPTLFHIVNILSDLSLGKCVAASVVHTQGAKDFSDQKILK